LGRMVRKITRGLFDVAMPISLHGNLLESPQGATKAPGAPPQADIQLQGLRGSRDSIERHKLQHSRSDIQALG
jgi:hypothetical protein